MSNRNYLSRDGGRHYSDPTSSRFNMKTKYYSRGRGSNRPVPNRRPTAGAGDIDRITVSIGRNLTTDGNNVSGSTMRNRVVNRSGGPQQIYSTGQMNNRNANQVKWWRVSIPQAGAIGKERVMSTLKVHCARQFQPYHVIEFKRIEYDNCLLLSLFSI